MRTYLAIFASTAATAGLLYAYLGEPDNSDPATSSSARPLTQPGVVDPVLFRDADGYYFQTADRQITCGIRDEPTGQPRRAAGCQGATGPAPSHMEKCWSSDPKAAAVAVGEDAGYLCVNQGFYTGPQAEPGTVLPAGSTLHALGFTCRADTFSVLCSNDEDGHGFEIAPDSNRLF
ncbi:hypothetical protein DFR70_12495 [Nocardia tenerifensis]|uniref:Uncharacterized protein n=1 Tax=Nocardia tenerifensis TaxID=228006 RepID=A0A318JN02_9NOCA|nr:hypothetical protein [Nocardia tenerifensis]PXX54654.1 hypothetical protein DFR70_12495 [Nocardia tenerifensis]